MRDYSALLQLTYDWWDEYHRVKQGNPERAQALREAALAVREQVAEYHADERRAREGARKAEAERDARVPLDRQPRIYAVRSLPSGFIKIGISNNPARRVSDLQTGSAERLELIGTRAGNSQEEERLHRIFGDLRVNGEWFRPGHLLLSWTETLLPPLDVSRETTGSA